MGWVSAGIRNKPFLDPGSSIVVKKGPDPRSGYATLIAGYIYRRKAINF
jgi:hypothetical protein